jgi:hypothetical protein
LRFCPPGFSEGLTRSIVPYTHGMASDIAFQMPSGS